MVYNPFIIVEILEADAVTVICELPRRWDVQGTDPLNVAGLGQVSVLGSDSVFDRHPTLFDMNNWVRFTLCDGLGNDEVMALVHIRKLNTRYFGEAEEADYIRTVSGPTLHGVLLDFMVKHNTQPPRPDAQENRAYTWASPVDEWYEVGSWSDTCTSVGVWKSHITDSRSGTVAKPKYKPQHWPDKAAEWIHVTGGSQWQFYRDVVTIPSGGRTIRWFLTADEVVLGFIDGDVVISRDESETGYKGFGEYKGFLPAGDYQLAVMMRKVNTAGGDGIDAWLGTMWTVNLEGDIDALVKRSNNTWRVHNGLPPPGWKPAEILRSIVLEAQARGNNSANLLTLDFTKTVDSNGDNWVTEINRTFPISSSCLDVQGQLSELGDFDVYVNPNNFKIQAFLRRGTDLSANITLEPGRNLINWEVEEVDAVSNIALVQYEGGWLTRSDATSIAAYGEREIGINLGQVGDDDSASAIVDAHIETKKSARKRAGAAEEWNVDQDKQPVGAIVPALGATPFLDFKTGDSIKAPTHTGVKKKQRLVGLSFAEDNDTALVSFDPEFAEED